MFFGALYWQCGLQGSYKVDQRHRVAVTFAFGRRRHGPPSAGRLLMHVQVMLEDFYEQKYD